MVDSPPDLVRDCQRLKERINGIRKFREQSGREATQKLAARPTLFGEIRQPSSRYLLIPKVSSQSRKYIPIGFLPPSIIASGSALVIPGAKLYDFGVLCSNIHNIWMRYVCGRMKSDYQYSNNIVYNNFPWPEGASETQKAKVEECAQAVLDARQPFLHAGQTLADLYDPLTMPAVLLKAHQSLDRAVDRCYRKEPFENDRQRVEFLFALYQKLTAPLIPASKPPRRKKS